MSEVVLVLVTTPNADKAAELARTLVEEGLAACGNIVPAMRSIYWWEGKLCDESEALLLLKTRGTLFDKLRERVVSLHPYKCPEVLQVEVSGGHRPYLDWVLGSVAR